MLARPHVIIETEQRGLIEIELFGPEAPLTVANFLRLVDRHFFDGNRWHRVVPNFVVQDGDPRGDGFGGPGGAIRDEINRQRYDEPMLGMALSGPGHRRPASGSSLSARSRTSTAPTPCSAGWRAATTALARVTQGDLHPDDSA